MPSSLTSTKIKDTYGQVLHVDGGVTSTPKVVYDGDGTATALKVSTTDVQVNNSPVLTDADIGSTVQATLVSGTNIKTINGTSILGSGNISIAGGSGTVTSVAMSAPTGLTVSGSPITTSGTLAVTYTAGYAIPTTAKQTEWDSAYTQRLQWDGGSTNLVAATGRTSLGLGTAATMAGPAGTIVGTTDTQTITNKRVTPRIITTTSSATPTINTDTVDMYGLTAQAVDITSFSANLTGTPTDGQKLWIYIIGTGARAITWGASFESSTVPLPTTTVSTDRLDVGFVWNAATSKWRCVATA